MRVRSDIERKRLRGLAASARTGSSAVAAGLYGSETTRRDLRPPGVPPRKW